MELSNILFWFLSTLGSTGVLVVFGYLCRDMLFKYYEKKISSKFEKEVEEFRSLIREKESHIALINSYLTNLEMDRSKVRHEKQLVAAEECLKLIKVMSKLGFLIEILQHINFKKVFSEKRELELKGFGEQLYRDCNVENVIKEMNELNNNFIDLYLESDILNNLRIVHGITMFAIILITSLKDGTTEFLKKENKKLVISIIDYLPNSKKAFEEHGDEYMFIWHDYFSEKTLNALRYFVHGSGRNSDITNIQKITISARKIYNDVPNDLKIQRF